MSDAPRIAVIGAGGWGKNHVRTWFELGQLHTVCDLNEEVLDGAVAGKPGVERTSDPADIFADPDVDAVVVATPAQTHADIAIAAMEAGKDVLVEKPLAISVVDGERIEETSHRLGRVAMVGHVLEFHPAVLALRSLVSAGELGSIRSAYSNRLNLGRVRTHENVFWSFAPHDLALVLGTFDELPTSIACQTGSFLTDGLADTACATMSFDAGQVAHVFTSWLHPFKEQRFVVVGTDQMAVFDDTAPWAQKLTLFAHTAEIDEFGEPRVSLAEGRPQAVAEGSPLTLQCQGFSNAVRAGAVATNSARDGLEVLRLLAAADVSAADGGRPRSLT